MTDPEYIMKLASYARNEMYLRSAPMFMLVEGAQYDMVKPFIRKWVPHIIKRADELTEVIALFISKHGQIGSGGTASLPASLKKGIADSFHNFDAYQFAKYDRDGEVKLKDVLRLVHPKPKNDVQALLNSRVQPFVHEGCNVGVQSLLCFAEVPTQLLDAQSEERRSTTSGMTQDRSGFLVVIEDVLR